MVKKIIKKAGMSAKEYADKMSGKARVSIKKQAKKVSKSGGKK